jgi:quercetin dioxygenase-like cupin family protein
MPECAIGSFEGLAVDEPYPGVRRQSFDATGATVTRYEFAARARFPRHRHEQEQITLVNAGSVTMLLGDDERRLTAGAWSVVPGGVEHGITAGEDGARITALIVPRRQRADAYEVVG